jgi:hypothetical protein
VLNADRAVTQDGDVRVTGTTAINAAGQTVLLDRVANDFTGRVTVDAGDVTLHDASDLSLAGSITGNLISTSQALLLGPTTVGGTAVLNADRAVTQDGDVRVTGTTAINAAGQTVLLDRVANDFTGRVTVDAGDVTLRDASDLSLAGSITGNLISTSQALLLGPTTVGGTAVLNAGGAVTQDGDVRGDRHDGDQRRGPDRSPRPRGERLHGPGDGRCRRRDVARRERPQPRRQRHRQPHHHQPGAAAGHDDGQWHGRAQRQRRGDAGR